MSKNVVKHPQPSSRASAEEDERAKLLAWLAQYKPRTELGRKLVAKRLALLESRASILDYEELMAEARLRRGGQFDE